MDSDTVEEIESVTHGKPITFKEGYPDFSEYTYQAKGVDGKAVSAEVEIELSKAGNREQDFARARTAMAEKLGSEKFKEPHDWTWHHVEDGTTMQLVPTELYNNMPHTEGVSMAKDPNY